MGRKGYDLIKEKDPSIKNKRCGGENGCGKLYPATEEYFPKDGRSKNGLGSSCRACLVEYCARRYLKNKEKIREWSAVYYLKNKVGILKRGSIYRSKNKNTINKKQNGKYSINRELCLTTLGHKCAWPECEIARSEFLAFDHKDNDGAKHRKEIGSNGPAIINWLIKNDFPKDRIQLLCHNHNWLKERMRRHSSLSMTSAARWARKSRAELKLEVLTRYSPDQKLHCSCPGCEVDNIDLLSLDHEGKRGVGAKHRKEMKNQGGTLTYLWLKNKGFPEGYRTLCHNCNKSFGSYGYCPHV